MSYNLYAEGVAKMEYFSRLARSCTGIEMFPITGDGEGDAIGLALPSSRISPQTLDELDEILDDLLRNKASVFDLMSGERIASRDDFAALHARIGGVS